MTPEYNCAKNIRIKYTLLKTFKSPCSKMTRSMLMKLFCGSSFSCLWKESRFMSSIVSLQMYSLVVVLTKKYTNNSRNGHIPCCLCAFESQIILLFEFCDKIRYNHSFRWFEENPTNISVIKITCTPVSRGQNTHLAQKVTILLTVASLCSQLALFMSICSSLFTSAPDPISSFTHRLCSSLHAYAKAVSP